MHGGGGRLIGPTERIKSMADKKVTIEVDGRKLEAVAGQMLIEVTDAAGIEVPRFCYHKKLSVAANCRMCLVEVEKAPKPLPACATPVIDGMVVKTRSPLAIQAQQGTMEFLLINHPLDCPICDQGGECELQDVSLGYGNASSRYVEVKRAVVDEDIGPLIETEMTRCIHCTRCVRFGAEIAGIRELGATGRGEHMRIGTYVGATVAFEMSGNIIDLCPVGALTAKPSRYQARAWELNQADGIAPHDSVGSNIHLHLRRGRVIRVVPADNEEINETWISDRDRFAYQGLTADDRAARPLVKRNGSWREIEWSDALALAAEKLKAAGAETQALASPHATLEELFLLRELMAALKAPSIDYRLRQGDFRAAPKAPGYGLAIADIESLDAALLVGSNLRKELPIINHRLRKAVLNGAAAMVVNPADFEFNYPIAEGFIAPPATLVDALAAVARAAGASADGVLGKLIDGAEDSEQARAIAKRLEEADKAWIALGPLAVSHPDFSLLQGLAGAIAAATGATLGFLPTAANSVGAALLGCVPGEGGLDARAQLAAPAPARLLLDIEPAADLPDPSSAMRVLDESDFVVAVTPFASESLKAVADLILPMAAFSETAGSHVNGEGRVQSFAGCAPPPGEARPGWKILRVLGTLLELDGFDYESPEQVTAAARAALASAAIDNGPGEVGDGARWKARGLQRLGDVPLYRLDALTRRATALQQTPEPSTAFACVHPRLARRLRVADGDLVRVVQGDAVAEMPLRVSARIPDDTVWCPAAVDGAETLGPCMGDIKLEKA